MKITINTHHCTREEGQELLNYLDNEVWDYTQEEDKSCEHSFIDVDNEGVYGKEYCRFCNFTQNKGQ